MLEEVLYCAADYRICICKSESEMGSGRDIRKQREDVGISQRELALQMGIASSTLCEWELGRKRMPEERIHDARAAMTRLIKRRARAGRRVRAEALAGPE